MKERNRFYLFVVVVFIFLVFMSYYFFSGSRESLEKLVLADADQPAFSLVYLADELGFFEDEGLEVQFIKFNSGRDALSAALNGEADIATVFETPLVVNLLSGADVGVITELHSAEQNVGIVARKDAGILNVSDLRRKKIAVTSKTGAEFLAHVILLQVGLQPEDVTWVDTDPLSMVTLLQSGEVDAIASWNPHLLNAKGALGAENVVEFYSSQIKEVSVLGGNRLVIEEKRDVMLKLLKALDRAEHLLDKEDLVYELLVDRFDYAEDYLEVILRTTNFDLRLSNILELLLLEELEWFKSVSSDYHDINLDFDRIIMRSLLEEVDSNDVTLL